MYRDILEVAADASVPVRKTGKIEGARSKLKRLAA
ncbi:hypothetical protein ABIA33_004986 [Streptacidiphilus sp. MAP12-16]